METQARKTQKNGLMMFIIALVVDLLDRAVIALYINDALLSIIQYCIARKLF